MRTIPQVPSGFQGLTSCCHADGTFYETTLVCRACGNPVQPVEVTGQAAIALEWAVKAQIDERITAAELLTLQNAILQGHEMPTQAKGLVISAEEIERHAEKPS